MRDIKALGKTLGRNHRLAVALWATGVYEARMLASFVGDPEQLTAAQMDRWCKDFDKANRLANSNDATARRVGKDALRELTSAAVTTRLKA
jgi:3-methyladenine DNA glycosylase AlkD